MGETLGGLSNCSSVYDSWRRAPGMTVRASCSGVVANGTCGKGGAWDWGQICGAAGGGTPRTLTFQEQTGRQPAAIPCHTLPLHPRDGLLSVHGISCVMDT